MSGNLLGQETSPYLLQHKDNPVAWRPWGEAALEEAARSNKPLLVSVGYSACHWCHVMAHESFDDAETANLMNELYVCVKVDREERPDIDQWLQTMLQGIGVGGGWPLTAFLTPQGEPFTGGTYFPKEERYGRASFKNVLKNVADTYNNNATAVRQNVEQLTQLFTRISNQNRSGNLSLEDIEHAAIRISQSFDVFFGGVTGAPKFPNVPLIETVWRGWLRNGVPQFAQLATVALDQMCLGGIYDHLAGGFARYSTDDRWLLPHFEKMLYDNAQMIDILTLVWQHDRKPLYRVRVEETVDWLLKDMLVEGAAFASSLDADTDGEEGKYYLWSDAEVTQALAGTFLQRFKEAYDVLPEGNFQVEGRRTGANVLNRLIGRGFTDADESLFVTQRQMLLRVRQQRTNPPRDDKVLADWNGLAIHALADASFVFSRKDWLAAAERAFAFVVEKLSEGDRLFHAYAKGKRGDIAFADDYASMIRAALSLYEMTTKKSYLEHARAWTDRLTRDFWDEAMGGYLLSSEKAGPIAFRARTATDSHTPSANGLMISQLARLYFATGNGDYAERADTLLRIFSGDLAAAYLQMGTFINGFEYIATGLQIVIVGPRGDERTNDLLDAVAGRSLPNRFLLQIEPGDTLPVGHPAFGKAMINNQPTVYICQQGTCSAPITSPVTLAQALLLPPNRAAANS